MARILYELRKNNNSHNKGYGRWYAHSKSDEVMDTRKLANHIASLPSGKKGSSAPGTTSGGDEETGRP